MSRFTRLARFGRRAALALVSLTVVGCTDPLSPDTASDSSGGSSSSTTISGRVDAGGRNVHVLSVGLYDNYVVVEGDGDTDLDCWLYDAAGRLVSSDTDLTDVCVLPAPGIGTHQVVIRNFGNVYNDYTIWMEN